MKTTADVVIVGGGCMGVSAAYYLTQRGVTDIVLVERERLLGTGSTGRNAGGARHQFSTEANIRLSIESIRLFEHFRDEIGYDADFHQHGYLFLLSTEKSVAAFQKNVDFQRRFGIDVDWLDGQAAADLAPGLDVDGVLGATFCAKDGIADPNGVTMGFAKAAQAAGVHIARETEVVGVKLDGHRVASVVTSGGEIATRTVVNAAGPYARGIGQMVGLDVPVDPYRRHIFISQPPHGIDWDHPAPGAARLVPPNRIMVIDFDSTFYFHREGANVLFGMGDPNEPIGFDTTVNWEFLDTVTRAAVRRLPALTDASISHAWAGLYEMTPDAMPIIGAAEARPDFFTIAGFSGHGFQHSPAAGRILADLITGQNPGLDTSPFAFERFASATDGGEGYVV